FGGAHHACRIHCFICRNEDEAIDTIAFRGFHKYTSSSDVVLHRLTCIPFHERYVLVSSSVEDNGGPMFIQHVRYPTRIGDISNYWVHSIAVTTTAISQLVDNVIQAVLVALEENQRLGIATHNLTTQLRADRTSSSRYEH